MKKSFLPGKLLSLLLCAITASLFGQAHAVVGDGQFAPINLNFNQLTSLPPEIGCLKNLDYLITDPLLCDLKRRKIIVLETKDEAELLLDKCRDRPSYKKQILRLLKDTNHIAHEWLGPEAASAHVANRKCCSTEKNAKGPVEKYFYECKSQDQLIPLQIALELDKNLAEQIQILVLQRLWLKEIPPFVFKLKNLERLFLENNSLTEIPGAIGELQELRFLGLGRNNLSCLPVEFELLKKLGSITLDKNPLNGPRPPFPHFEGLPELKFISVDVAVAIRWGLEPLTDGDRKIMEKVSSEDIRKFSVLVNPHRGNAVI
ncbi:leucine-rich repeat domain-containing protein [bacterium]|nr:leucine-rich repeat domain-containing protein [bacterium]